MKNGKKSNDSIEFKNESIGKKDIEEQTKLAKKKKKQNIISLIGLLISIALVFLKLAELIDINIFVCWIPFIICHCFINGGDFNFPFY